LSLVSETWNLKYVYVCGGATFQMYYYIWYPVTQETVLVLMDFKFPWWFTANVDLAFGCLHHVEVGWLLVFQRNMLPPSSLILWNISNTAHFHTVQALSVQALSTLTDPVFYTSKLTWYITSIVLNFQCIDCQFKKK
jgi:hypothetical protein